LVALRVYSLLAFGWWEKAVFAQRGSWLQRADHGLALAWCRRRSCPGWSLTGTAAVA